MSHEASSRHPPGTRRRRVVRYTGVGIAVALGVAAVAGAAAYFKLDANLNVFSSEGLSHHRPPAPSGGAENVLLIGSDSRAGGYNQRLGGGPSDGGARSDTTILLHVYAGHQRAVAVSIPRDSLVTLPPCRLATGQWTQPQPDAPFNTAFSVGGSNQGNPTCTQNTVEALTGLRVDHTIVLNFAGFAAMTDAIGGVRVCVPNSVDSEGIHLAQGVRTLEGQQALDYVRARHGLGDGSDIGRIKRQQAFLSSLLRKILTMDVLSDPVRTYDLADAATRSMTVDPGLDSVRRLVAFAHSLRGLTMSKVSFVTAPWQYDGAHVALVHPDVDVLWRLLREGRPLNRATTGQEPPSRRRQPPSVPHRQILVSVYNGSSVDGLATRTADELGQEGFDVTGAYSASTYQQSTTISYGPGQLQAAQELARSLPGAQLVSMTDGDAPLAVVLGDEAANATGVAPGTPTGIVHNTRPATSPLCSDISYGS